MSTVRHNDVEPVDEEEHELTIDDPEELAEIEAAIADADADPDAGIDAWELLRQLRERREDRG